MNWLYMAWKGIIREVTPIIEDLHNSTAKFDLSWQIRRQWSDKIDKERPEGWTQVPIGLPKTDTAITFGIKYLQRA